MTRAADHRWRAGGRTAAASRRRPAAWRECQATRNAREDERHANHPHVRGARAASGVARSLYSGCGRSNHFVLCSENERRKARRHHSSHADAGRVRDRRASAAARCCRRCRGRRRRLRGARHRRRAGASSPASRRHAGRGRRAEEGRGRRVQAGVPRRAPVEDARRCCRKPSSPDRPRRRSRRFSTRCSPSSPADNQRKFLSALGAFDMLAIEKHTKPWIALTAGRAGRAAADGVHDGARHAARRPVAASCAGSGRLGQGHDRRSLQQPERLDRRRVLLVREGRARTGLGRQRVPHGAARLHASGRAA